VAHAAGVSRGAVSQILNGRGQRFSAETRDRVEQAARSLAYEPSAAGRMLARGRSDLVVAVVPNTTFGAHLQDIVDVLTTELAAAGLTLVLRFSTTSKESFDKLIAGMRPMAVLPLGPLSDEERRVLAVRRVPVVGGAGESAETPAPQHDANYAIGALQADHLVGRGHARLAFALLHDARQDPYGAGRLQGFRDRCRELGMPEPGTLSMSVDVDEAVRELRRLDGPGTAIACYNDDLALTLVAGAQRIDWCLPDDLAVIGVDNMPLARVLSPRITTVAYDSSAVAQDLARAVLGTLLVGDSWQPSPVELSVVQGDTT
jgi:DNA-binding LacI/PurR family transcriptional regulator